MHRHKNLHSSVACFFISIITPLTCHLYSALSSYFVLFLFYRFYGCVCICVFYFGCCFMVIWLATLFIHIEHRIDSKFFFYFFFMIKRKEHKNYQLLLLNKSYFFLNNLFLEKDFLFVYRIKIFTALFRIYFRNTLFVNARKVLTKEHFKSYK